MGATSGSKCTKPSGQAQASRGDEGRHVRDLATRYWNEFKWCVVPAYIPLLTYDGDLRCSCKAGVKCDKPGKHPIGPWGEVEYATAKDRWFDPGIPWLVNVSLLTGRRSGVVVADVDPRHGGKLATLWELGWSPNTPIARTGGGGWHVLALCPPDGLRSVDAYAQGIELKADGKQVILPPSRHGSRRHYRWLKGRAPWERAVAPLPESVIEAVRAAAGVGRAVGGMVGLIGANPERDDPAALVYSMEETLRIATALYRKYLRLVLDPTSNATRNNTAFLLARQLDSLGMTRAEVLEWVVAWGREVAANG